MKLIKIGDIGVDGGELVIADPIYAKMLPEGPILRNGAQAHRVGFPSAAVFDTGDGDYPVFAITDENNQVIGALVWLDKDADGKTTLPPGVGEQFGVTL